MPELEQIVARLRDWNSARPAERGDLLRALTSQTQWRREEIAALVDALSDVASAGSPEGAGELFTAAADAILNANRGSTGEIFSPANIATLRETYLRLDGADRARAQILRLLATDASRTALATLAELLVEHPPLDYRDAVWGITPLVQRRRFPVDALFPRLLDGLSHRQTAALILDLANFAARKKLVPRHPAADRAGELSGLLGQIVQHLARIEEDPRQFGQSPEELRKTVDESIALCIALCDTLALIGDQVAVPKLHQALELSHRRVRTEAAAALAALGDKRGIEVLVDLAADPATRTRALAYLEERDALEKAKPEFRSPVARAAAELADWLAEPGQFGAPPHTVEWIDTCRQHWPGYDGTVDCRLFVFTYRLRDGEFSGVGIVGPVTYSLASDLEDLPPDDIYAGFAGWQAEHEEMREIAAEDLPEWKRKQFDSRLESLTAEGYANVQLVKVGHFFGDEILVASAQRDGRPGTVIVDGDEIEWHGAGTIRRPIGPTEAYFIHKGRKLLRTFNPNGVEHLDESAIPAED